MAADMDTGIDWRGYLDKNYEDVPLHALRYSATRRINMFLCQEQVMTDDIVPNFGGLAELVGFDGIEIKNFERAADPGKAVLDEWMRHPEFDPTLGHLVKLLAELGREDILTDCKEMIARDAKHFLDKPKQFLNNTAPVQENTVSQGPGSDEVPELITMGEVMEGRQLNYDAFVCFNAYGESSKDFEFVKELIRRFESPPYNFRLFVPHRDDLAGLAKHNITATIISQRCRHMIVVLSNNFMESPACTFQSAFAHSLSPGAQNKRLIPVVIEEMREMPNIMRIITPCDFTKKILYDWSWDRLASSISMSLKPEDYQVDRPVPMEGFLPQSTPDMSSSFLPAESSTLPSSVADSGCWSPQLMSPGGSEISGSSQQSAGSSHSNTNTSTGASTLGLNRQARSGSSSSESQGKVASSAPRTACPSSPGLGSRALKKLKQTFSSDKRKSGPQPGI